VEKEFPNWYRHVSADPRAETLKARWKAIDKIVRGVGVEDVEQLVLLLFGIGDRNVKLRTDFESALQEADAAYAIGRNAAELSVIAGSALGAIINGRKTAIADYAALGVVCVDCRGLGPQASVPEILLLAREHCKSRSPDLAPFTLPPAPPAPKIDLAQTQQATVDPSGLQKQVNSALSQLQKVSAAGLESVAVALSGVIESAEIAWWILGEFSRDLGIPIRELPLPCVPLVVGKELADLTIRLPGPRSASAFLHRMMRNVDSPLPPEIEVAKAIDETPSDWRKLWVGNLANGANTMAPIASAAASSVAKGSGSDWAELHARASSIDPAKSLSPLGLARQVFDEAILLRMRDELSSQPRGR
jgi:hypothetical protein